MLFFPNAKINIGLNIIEKRKDGFHNIESIMYPVGLSDALEFVPATDGVGGFSNPIAIESGLQVDSSANDNLVVKAYNLLALDYKMPILDINLHKVIPFGAGLGGGSADAAFMLKALNAEYELGITTEQLSKYAAKLGSDCPFFIENKPAFISGVGDIIQPVDFTLSGYHLIIIVPPLQVSTKVAYSNINPIKTKISIIDLVTLPIEKWKDVICNDFEINIFAAFPEIKIIKNNLYRLGASYASMTGSGSAVFGLFRNEIEIGNQFGDSFIWQEYLK